MWENAKAMVLASFAADSLALGVHWVYDTALIDKQFGRVEHLLKPPGESYHPIKERGEFTHYGDQALMLLYTLAGSSGFNLEDFAQNWQDFFKTYLGMEAIPADWLADLKNRDAIMRVLDRIDPEGK